MIYKLRNKFIKICFICFVSVFIALFSSIYFITAIQTNSSLDATADLINENNGRFPSFGEFYFQEKPPKKEDKIGRESPFTTRYFCVFFNEKNQIISIDTRSIASVSSYEAADYAAHIIEIGKDKGWANSFRYKVYSTDNGKTAVFINGDEARRANNRFLISASLVFAVGSIIVMALVILLSKKAVKPAAESYEKQKQFVTDAGHELKTPLTLIRTNIDIMESEFGENEWLCDLKDESKTMTELVNKLVTLSKMDEDTIKAVTAEFNLSDAVTDTACAFFPRLEREGKTIFTHLPPNITYKGDESDIRQLVSILMDNAAKYCDEKGTVAVALYGGKHPIITVDNTFKDIDSLELNKLFNRFYRADKARTYGTGFGIGLSIAKSIVQKHKGTISAEKLGSDIIRFRVDL